MIRTKLFHRALILSSTLAIANFATITIAIQTQPATAIAATNSATPQLKLKARGAAVKLLQNSLKRRGFYKDSVTGNFDYRTEAAVKAFQQRYQLPVTGIVNAGTWKILLNPPWQFALPPRGAPGNRGEAGTRGVECPVLEEGQQGMTALVSDKNFGFTNSERPTFWFYIPYQPEYSIEFILKDEQAQEIFKQTIPLTATPGIISISYSSAQPPLAVGKKYVWLLSLICNPEKRDKDLFVKGYVERKPSTSELTNQLQQAETPRDRFWVYAANGLWYETLTNLIAERRKNPKDTQLQDDWKELLKTVKLEAISSAPVVNCCTPEK